MENKGLVIFLIVFWTVVGIGLIAFMCSIISGRSTFEWGLYKVDKNDEIIFEKTYDLEQINFIKVLSNAGDVKFEESSSDAEVKVVVYGEDGESVDVDISNNCLKVDNTKHKNKHIINFRKYIDNMVIYLPKAYNKEIFVELDYGNIEMIDLENASVTLDIDCGDIDIGKVKNVKIDSDYGSINIASVLNKLDIETNCGDVDIKTVNLKENSKISSDLGNVKIGDTNDIFIDTSVDLGDCKVNKNNRQAEITLKIEMDCGDIKVGN